MRWSTATLVLALGGATALVGAGWERLAVALQLAGAPVPASEGNLSEHELEEIEGLPPQAQAERLLKRAVSGYGGALEQIAKRAAGWVGQIELNESLHAVTSVAYCSNNLRVRAAAVEVSLAGYGLAKTPESVDAQMRLLEDGGEKRFFPLWKLGLLGNRGVEPEKVLRVLLRYRSDAEQVNRLWAVNALGMLGSDEVIEPLIEVFRTDPSAEIRERAACNLADAGMLTREQRRKAIPYLLHMTDEGGLDEQTRGWVYQALREISGESIGADPTAWRNWWDRKKD
ncbi:MAG: HEAT repeat domain-containing protein [Bryobacteraceae bacterium]|nr:HEAT repeat domain-containing protein [Bryobacteraceae bacterium]